MQKFPDYWTPADLPVRESLQGINIHKMNIYTILCAEAQQTLADKGAEKVDFLPEDQKK
jgi:hypothetical protein